MVWDISKCKRIVLRRAKKDRQGKADDRNKLQDIWRGRSFQRSASHIFVGLTSCHGVLSCRSLYEYCRVPSHLFLKVRWPPQCHHTTPHHTTPHLLLLLLLLLHSLLLTHLVSQDVLTFHSRNSSSPPFSWSPISSSASFLTSLVQQFSPRNSSYSYNH
jgi:hypothetical protein